MHGAGVYGTGPASLSLVLALSAEAGNDVCSMRRLISARIPTFVVALALWCGIASGAGLVVTGVDSGRGMGSYIGTPLWFVQKGTPTDVTFAGVIAITVTDGANQYQRDSLCVDLFTDINLGSSYQTTLKFPNSLNLGRVSWLVDNALLPTQSSGYTSALGSADWVKTPAQGAGIQLAIWDIVHDGGDGFSSGNVQASTAAGEATDPDVLFWAQTYEAASLNKSDNNAFVYDNRDNNGVEVQRLIGPQFSTGPSPTPEPVAWALMGTVALVLGIAAYRRRSTKAPSNAA